jgi:hypothetical protein
MYGLGYQRILNFLKSVARRVLKQLRGKPQWRDETREINQSTVFNNKRDQALMRLQKD